jgi:hypothetical protein
MAYKTGSQHRVSSKSAKSSAVIGVSCSAISGYYVSGASTSLANVGITEAITQPGGQIVAGSVIPVAYSNETISGITYLSNNNLLLVGTQAANIGGGNVLLTGAGFTTNSNIALNGTTLSNVVVNQSQLIVTLPASSSGNSTLSVTVPTKANSAPFPVQFSLVPVWTNYFAGNTVLLSTSIGANIQLPSNVVYGAGDSVTFSLALGSPPNGMTLNSNGYITGLPSSTTYLTNTDASFSVVATNTKGQSTSIQLINYHIQTYSILLNAVQNNIVTAANVYYSQTVTATGNLGAVTWTTSTLPTGLSLSSNGNIANVTGYPVSTGSYNYTVTATDSYSVSNTQTYSGTISASPSYTATVFMVGGGGNGQNLPVNNEGGGGGGGGGLGAGPVPINTGFVATVVVGGGGGGATSFTVCNGPLYTNMFPGIAYGGGGGGAGGGANGAYTACYGTYYPGQSGGYTQAPGQTYGPTGQGGPFTYVIGYGGGRGYNRSGGGGGGGLGGAGANSAGYRTGSGGYGGAGGSGITRGCSGTPRLYSTGGGGGGNNSCCIPVSAPGGAGGNSSALCNWGGGPSSGPHHSGGSAPAGSGGGGGGAVNRCFSVGSGAGNGGSGLLVISYSSPVQRGTGGTVTGGPAGPVWYHTFTGSGTYIG